MPPMRGPPMRGSALALPVLIIQEQGNRAGNVDCAIHKPKWLEECCRHHAIMMRKSCKYNADMMQLVVFIE